MEEIEKKLLYERLLVMENSINRILYILENDNKINHSGLVEIVRESEHRINELELYNKINKAKSATYGTIAGFVVVVVWHLVKLTFNIFFSK